MNTTKKILQLNPPERKADRFGAFCPQILLKRELNHREDRLVDHLHAPINFSEYKRISHA